MCRVGSDKGQRGPAAWQGGFPHPEGWERTVVRHEDGTSSPSSLEKPSKPHVQRRSSASLTRSLGMSPDQEGVCVRPV